MGRMKKKIPRRMWIGTLAIAGLLAVGLTSGFPPQTPWAESTPEDNLDRQFKRLGITRIPNIPPPMDFALQDLDGGRVRLSELKGKVVVINFWTTWCPSCRIEMPDLEKLHQRFKADDFVLLAVDLRESRQTVRQYLQAHKLSFTALLDSDGEVGQRFGIRSIPTTFILDQNGGMVGKAIGARQWGSDRAFAFFEYLIDAPLSAEDNDKIAPR